MLLCKSFQMGQLVPRLGRKVPSLLRALWFLPRGCSLPTPELQASPGSSRWVRRPEQAPDIQNCRCNPGLDPLETSRHFVLASGLGPCIWGQVAGTPCGSESPPGQVARDETQDPDAPRPRPPLAPLPLPAEVLGLAVRSLVVTPPCEQHSHYLYPSGSCACPGS